MEPSHVVGGVVNWHSYFGKQIVIPQNAKDRYISSGIHSYVYTPKRTENRYLHNYMYTHVNRYFIFILT